MTSIDRLKQLGEQVAPGWMSLCNNFVLDVPAFAQAPASSSHHPGPHQEPGGLALHTLEVAEFADEMARYDFVLRQRAYVAAVFHDYGKIFEYAFVDGKATNLPFRHRVGHVVYGWHHFNRAATLGASDEEYEEIGHALLAHHGRREWGSPVEPQTRLAYILHTADMMSSRGVL